MSDVELKEVELEGEKVLVVRRGGELFAIGATCTHYGGPLAEGLVTGDHFRCPWHHACFDLRTGEATHAPALASVPVYDVEDRDGQFVVKRRAGVPPAGPAAVPAAAPSSVAIVGAGPAGFAAAEMLRRRGYSGALTMIGAEATPPVDRPNLSKDYLAGHAPEEWIPLRSPEWYSEQNIELITGHRVLRLDAASKELAFDDGTARRFDAILLATGADPVRLPLPGGDLPHVHYLRTLADSRAIIAAADQGKRAVILGAGFIGLEVAASLRTREVAVTVVAPEEIPLARIMGDEVGRFVQSLHEEHGVVFRLGMTAKSIDAEGVTLADGTRLEADLVVIGTGVRPNIQLAEEAGLRIDKGIAVNERLETSAPGIWAAGDVARWPDPISGRALRVEHFVVAERQGQCAARNILGAAEPFRDVPFFWSAHYDAIIAYVGNAASVESVEVRGTLADRNAIVKYRENGRITAVATIFRDLDSLRAEVAFEEGDQEALERL